MTRMTVAILLAGFFAVLPASAQECEARDIVTLSFEAEGIELITASTATGGIKVAAGEGELITVTVARRCIAEYEETAEEGLQSIVVNSDAGETELAIGIESGTEADGFRADITISAPPGTALNLEAETGSISINGMTGGIEANTTTGKIELTGTNGSVALAAETGEINLRTHSGSVDATTTTGTITCVLLEVEEGDEVELETESGPVTLRVPWTVSAELDASTGKGKITIHGLELFYDEQTDKAVVGTIGSGDAEITVSVGRGNISIGGR